MKKHIFLSLFLLCVTYSLTFSQNGLFHRYTDSTLLVRDANVVRLKYQIRIAQKLGNILPKAKAILNTSPYLVYWDHELSTINLPLWSQVIEPQKAFFTELNKSKSKGEEMFGLFFNGFYIIHELGHGTDFYLTKKANRKNLDFYEGEYLANQIAIAYWQEAGYEKELQKCYQYALKFTKQLPNPVPKGEDPLKFFNTNYDELSKDPFKYGYYQFKQFVEIYENRKTLHLDDLLK